MGPEGIEPPVRASATGLQPATEPFGVEPVCETSRNVEGRLGFPGRPRVNTHGYALPPYVVPSWRLDTTGHRSKVAMLPESHANAGFAIWASAR